MTSMPLAIFLAAIPAFSCLFFLVQCVKTMVTARPIILSSRRHFSFIGVPVMIMVGIALYKITVVPDFIRERPFLIFIVLFFTACYGVILTRGDWYFVFGAGKKELFEALRQSLLARDISFEENFVSEEEGSEHLTEFRLANRKSRLRVSVFSGQDMAQVGAIPSDNVLLDGLIDDLKEHAASLGGRRSMSGFLVTACILMGLACYGTFTQVHTMDNAWYTEKGRTYLETRRYPAAIATLSKAMDRDPANIQALRWRGKAYEETGRDALALEDWQKALDLDPSNSDIMAHMARLFFSSREVSDRQRALTLARNAVETQPDHVFALDTLAWILAQNSSFQEAALFQEKVVVILGEKKAAKDLMKKVTARLEAYKSGKPVLDQP
ncbi:MAG: tetratricopeptide repeat protein [Desulfatibacillum sp.]|nr:tetratricopeptide repeat protein [Desulfatibacillum sp.]